MPEENLNDLNEKLASFRAKNDLPSTGRMAEANNVNNGARAGVELVTSILAGGAIGWALDSWLHTRPWLLMLFLFAGVAAGFMSVYRVTNSLSGGSGSAALQMDEKTVTKPPEINDDEDDA